MPYNGSGSASSASGGSYPASGNTLIESSKFNTMIADQLTMFSTAICKDGQTTTTQRIPFAAGISTDTIAEKTSDTGVTIDSVLLKDGQVDGVDVSAIWTTGDVKLTLKTTADTGWVLFNDGTIGSASSGATTRANADCEDLFTLLWTNTTNANCAVSTGRGASAAADWAANKTIALPKALGRALAVYGSGSGLTARAMAQATGNETHTLQTTEIPAHNHGVTDAGHVHATSGNNFVNTTGATSLIGSGAITVGSSGNVDSATTGISINNEGGGGAHNNMQPTVFLNVMVKL